MPDMIRFSVASLRDALPASFPAACALSIGLLGTITPAAAQPANADRAVPARESATAPARGTDDDTPAKPGNAELTIDLKPTALMQGHDLRATIKVKPQDENRLLSVHIDAPTFYASTERELMGAESQRTFYFKWDKLPAGYYMVEARVTDAEGRLTRVQRPFTVYGGTLDGEMVPTTPTPGRRRRGR